MEAYQTTEDIKEEVVDCGFVEVDSQDDHQLCTTCLCATRTTRTLSDGALKQYYMHILTEMQPEGGVVLQSPRVCWECVSHLKRSVRFREQVQDSYRLLQPMLCMCNKEDLDEFLQTSVRRPGRLKNCLAFSIDISPQDDDMQVMTAAEHDDEAASGSSENDIEKPFQEYEASIIDEDPFEAICDEKYYLSYSEDVLESSPMCNYYDEDQDHDKSKKHDSHSRKEVLIDTKTVNTPNFTHVTFQHFEMNFVCDNCQKGFNSKAALERHIATYNIYPHNNKTVPSPCENCAAVLCSNSQCSECPNKHSLLQHGNMQAKTVEKHCLGNECDKSFSVEANLKRNRKVNPNEKPFQCEVCQKSFKRKDYLIEHSRIHTGEKPFQCEVCDKLFSQKNNMLSHLKIHTGEKPFQCEMCRKSFAQKSSLIKHTRMHTGEKPFQCEVCHKSFGESGALNKHSRIHTGQKPYQCEVCHKSFAVSSNLNTHKRIHTREKPYQCEVCHKSHRSKQTLIDHIRTHTNKARRLTRL